MRQSSREFLKGTQGLQGCPRSITAGPPPVHTVAGNLRIMLQASSCSSQVLRHADGQAEDPSQEMRDLALEGTTQWSLTCGLSFLPHHTTR